jgi:hypothetical protein
LYYASWFYGRTVKYDDGWFGVCGGPSTPIEWLISISNKVRIIDTLSADPEELSAGIALGSFLRPTKYLTH